MLAVHNDPGPSREKREESMAVATQPQIDVHDNSLAGARAWFAQRGLSRPREGRLLAGVCAGFARRYDINPLVARLLGIAGVLVLSPLVYIAAWVLMPNDAGGAPAAASSS
jgi:phage shock protein PspC (stress-responsive transcriptional regulator)